MVNFIFPKMLGIFTRSLKWDLLLDFLHDMMFISLALGNILYYLKLKGGYFELFTQVQGASQPFFMTKCVKSSKYLSFFSFVLDAQDWKMKVDDLGSIVV